MKQKLLRSIVWMTKNKVIMLAWAMLLGAAMHVQANNLAQAALPDVTVTGLITDEHGAGLPGVAILEKGTSNGTVTDIEGNYKLTVSDEATVVVSFVGYAPQEVAVGGRSVIDLQMTPDIAQLEEIVVVGYGTKRKNDVTGALSVVKMADIESTRSPNLTKALQGQIPGVQVASSSGAPGDPVTIRIRGEGTIGNNDPLYVVDGIPTRDLTFLNPSDVESMTVLKDAASAAIYGSRASGGVIVITTKKGSHSAPQVDINYFTGVLKPSNLPDMLNAKQYLNTLEQAWDNTYDTGTNPYIAEKARGDLSDTDWLDELFDKGRSHSLSVSVRGGGEKNKYLLSTSYYGEDGTIVGDKDKYERFTLRANTSSNITDRLELGTNLQLTYSEQDKVAASGESLIRFGMLRAPVLSVYKDPSDPTYSADDPFTDLPFYTGAGYDLGTAKALYDIPANPIAMLHFTDDVRKSTKIFGNVFAEYAFLNDKSLKFRTNLGAEVGYSHDKAFFENFGDDDGGGSAIDAGLGRNNRPNALNESRGEERTITFNNTLTYDKLIADRHQVTAMIGTEYVNNYGSSIGASRKRFTNIADEFQYLDYGASDLDVWNSGSASEWALFSYFGSASYTLDSKYIFTGSLRADASSRFSDENQWGYFPSLSAGWVISEEQFLNNVDWLSILKLRGSWGQLGNQEIANYAYLTLVSQVDGKVVIDRYGNEDLKWETSTQSNIGADVGVLDNKLQFTVEYFDILTSDILLPIGLPGVVGDVAPTILNAGEVRNKGFEFAMNYRNFDGPFKYSINANMATLKNEVEALHPNLPYISNADNRTAVGQPLNAYFGYEMIGIYQNQQEIEDHLSGTQNPSERPGDIKFKDISGDGVINADDRTFIGNPIPELTYGASFSAEYKGFDFFLLFQGVKNVDRYNSGKRILDWDSRPFNYTTDILNAWDGQGSSNSQPRVSLDDNGSSKFSTAFVEDASFLRMKNIELGYNLANIKGIQNLRFYVSAQNLFTLSDYSGLDPEAVSLADSGTYPTSKSFLLGVNVNF